MEYVGRREEKGVSANKARIDARIPMVSFQPEDKKN